jgi:WD40 repeat protein
MNYRGPINAILSSGAMPYCAALRIVLILLFSIFANSPAAAQPPITALAFSPNGSQIVVGSQLGAQVYDLDQKQVAQLDSDLEFVNAIRFSRDGKYVAVVGGSPSESGTVEVFDWPKGQRKIRKQISDDVLYDVDWSPDGRHLVIAGHDTDGFLLDTDTQQIAERWVDHSRPVKSFRFLADPNLLVSASFDQTVRVWETVQKKAVRSLNNHTAEINAIAVSPVGDQTRLKMLVSVGQDKTVRFWQPVIGRMIRFARLPSTPFAVQWDRQGRTVVVGCEDGNVVIVDSQTVKIERQERLFDGPIFCIARHPQQDVFAFGGFKNRWQVLTLDRLISGVDK